MTECIDRQAVLDAIWSIDPENDGSDGGTVVLQNQSFTSADIEGIICQIPTVDLEALPIVKELREKLERATMERDTAIKDRAELADFELTACEQFCFGDRKHDIPPCEWNRFGRCKLREWSGPVAENATTKQRPKECEDCTDLGVIEDILGDDYSLERLRELVEADNQGRIQVIPMRKGKECGACQHFQRIPGTRRGKCKVKPLVFSRYVSGGTPFEPSQSRKACMKFVPIKKEKSHE